MEALNKKNTETFIQVVKEQNFKLEEQQIRIDLLSNAVSNLTQRINELQEVVLIQKAKSIGTGSTAR